jgi:hypothetical protein
VEIAFHKPVREPQRCPECGHVIFRAKRTRREISYIASRCVQQVVPTGRDRPVSPMGWHSIDPSLLFFYRATAVELDRYARKELVSLVKG